ncbi:MAG: cobalamin biosynthesis protein P47K [Deltaproteobacteria bacterium]|jgi:G3E family GTPase|nr:cobalamin biosynthesis protein P47K [Deltaproteobacteria bacterium]MBW2482027.1 cobalamin biosynthesis protein P47K [Deltaproteobacteria bacterium]
MSSSRKLSVKKPVKMIFSGGFLGSGKTTALAALAKRLIEKEQRVGFITNDQSENLVDTIIVRQMLADLGVPVEEVVKGCFCCKFDELIEHVEKILAHDPDVLMGEPVGSCTDFVAAVANPIKIQYRDAFRFAPFSIMVDPERVRSLILNETQTDFPEDVAYLFGKQLEEADTIVLNKVDLLTEKETRRLLAAIGERYPQKKLMAVSAKDGTGMDEWLEDLISGRPGANTVLSQIDYDRYARAEAVLGWLNAAVKLQAEQPFDAGRLMTSLATRLRDRFKIEKGEIGHLKFVLTSSGKSMWANLTHLAAEPTVGGEKLDRLPRGTLIINARVKLEPEDLETIVRDSLDAVSRDMSVRSEIDDLQCFSPAYPEPPHIIREPIEG